MTRKARFPVFCATMWIHIQTPTKRLKLPELDATVEFSDKHTAQVSDEVGELLTDQYETITEYNNAE